MTKITKLIITFGVAFLLQACSDDDHPAPAPEPTPPAPDPVTVVDVAVDNGSFTTLVAALQATGLDATLADTSGSFTVFAPTDDAFALLGQETIDALLADPDTLSSILLYHVLPTEVDSTAAISAAGSTVETVNGASIGLSLSDDSLIVNTSTVTNIDIGADNGIIHVIDAVLMPPAMSEAPSMNIVDTAIADGRFTTLVTALQTADLVSTLADENTEFTVFAPTDDAFAMLGQDTIDALLANTDVLSSILLQHVVSGAAVDAVTAYSLSGTPVETASGAMIPVQINAETDRLTVGGANVIITDIVTTNGIIHVIDMVIVGEVDVPAPAMTVVDVAVENGSFTTLVAALQAAGLDSVLSDTNSQFTVFAPTDAAFALLGQEAIDGLLADVDALTNVLTYHVISDATILQDAAVSVAQSDMNQVTMTNGQAAALSLSGSSLYVNKSKVSLADVMADNGVIHVVDQVILPPSMRGEPIGSIVDVALADENFSTLVTALSAANLVDTLADETQTFTVFAPTNAAFDKIEDSALDGLLADTDSLTNVLLQHVIGGAEVSSLAAFQANGSAINTLANNDVTVALVNFTDAANDAAAEVAYDADNQRLVGGMNSSLPGLSLYVFDNDLGTAGSTCNDTCATNWPPVLVTDMEASSISGLSTVMRDNGDMQVAFMGRPLYFFAGDMAAGDVNGQGLNDVWWLVSQEQVSLQIQGSNVTTTDIYTTNGVIHVIDTVITETLE